MSAPTRHQGNESAGSEFVNGLLGGGQTRVVPRTKVEVDDQAENRMVVLDGGPTLDQLVDGLNALGVGPRDMIGIIQAIKAAGALQAEVEVM